MFTLPVIRYPAGIVNRDRCYWFQDGKKTTHNAQRVPPAPKDCMSKEKRARISECQSHNPRWNKEHPWIHQEAAPPGWTARKVPQAAEDKGWWRGKENFVEDQALHGCFICGLVKVAKIKKSDQWLQKASQRLEALITVAQGQEPDPHRSRLRSTTKIPPSQSMTL